jgi:putative endonuclease
MTEHSRYGRMAYRRGVTAEAKACAALLADGWTVHATRRRTRLGEIDIIAERDGVLAIIEVKARSCLAAAALALTPRQQARLIAAAEVVLAEHPEWGSRGVRFDVLLVDRAGQVRRIADAFRPEDEYRSSSLGDASLDR